MESNESKPADACASLWIGGELVHLEDLVLHDAGHDILERAGHINSAGVYLRDLTLKARRGEFSLGPTLMALMRASGTTGRKAVDPSTVVARN